MKWLEALPSRVWLDHASENENQITVGFSFSESGFGFGEVVICSTPQGVFIDGERMGPERVKKYLCALVDAATLDSDTDPERHARYNQVMGRMCAETCAACAAKGNGP